ncbi:ATP-binding cassette domain-containing protein [Proteiniclasticum sp. QWL-01]|uniref:ATP-binding cassette domain-containing protein n=1 Tax=Proteiniclasticum sp. QWL-01 TaxID=3036945 RepID=UPI00240EFA24|nr:ATP-binding cassette domain-containing protein [Proteiniclasticum sp. QWL-01]WFF72794.1 ATP-binding cassette domain-containing protein [Proteiniclasticum sp. QWL-01]
MISIHRLKKSFGRKKVLENLNLNLNEGVYGLLGANGAGKTTLLRCLTGIYPDANKHVLFTGESRPLIGYLPQSFGLFDHLTAGEALTLIGQMKGLPAASLADEVTEVLKKVNLLDRKDHRITTLSGGMIRRLGIAQTLLGTPAIRIYDEPTAGLDPEERLRFHQVVRQHAAQGLTLISTHIVEDIESTCQHVIILGNGRIIAQGGIQEITNQVSGMVFERATAPEFGNPDEILVKSYERDQTNFCRVLTRKPLATDLNPLKPTLEDAFLGITRGFICEQS